MAENLICEINTQFDLITNDLAALPREKHIAWFRRTTCAQLMNFLKETNGTTCKTTALLFLGIISVEIAKFSLFTVGHRSIIILILLH